MTSSKNCVSNCNYCIHGNEPYLPEPEFPGNSPEMIRARIEWSKKKEEIYLTEQEAVKVAKDGRDNLLVFEPRTLWWCSNYSRNAKNPITGEDVQLYALCELFNPNGCCDKYLE